IREDGQFDHGYFRARGGEALHDSEAALPDGRAAAPSRRRSDGSVRMSGRILAAVAAGQAVRDSLGPRRSGFRAASAFQTVRRLSIKDLAAGREGWTLRA